MNLSFDEYDFYMYVPFVVYNNCVCAFRYNGAYCGRYITLKYTANVGQFLVIVVIRTNFFTPTNCDRECYYQKS